VFKHLTNDYVYGFNPHTVGLDKSWNDLVEWTRREYLTMVGTTSTSYVGGGHVIGILKAESINLNGKEVKIMKLRNPWGSTKWTGKYAKGTPELATLEAHFAAKNIVNNAEGGKFYAEFNEYMQHCDDITVAMGQESRTGGAERPEWQPRVDLRAGEETHTLQVDLCKPVDFAQDVFAVSTFQGGNLVGTMKDGTTKPNHTTRFTWDVKNEDASVSVQGADWGVGINWDAVVGHAWYQGTPNWPAGRYTVTQTQKAWQPGTPAATKELTFGLSSPVPTVVKYLSVDDVAAAKGCKVVQTGANCEANGAHIGYFADVTDARKAAKAKNCEWFSFAQGQSGLPQYCCSSGAAGSSG